MSIGSRRLPLHKAFLCWFLVVASWHFGSAQTVLPGALPGDFSVSANGDAQYNIPVDVPPGIKHIEPSLSLVYSSNEGNGRLGVGWSLQGLSAIFRCKAVPAFDNYFGSINYNFEDRFCLDGQRLINVSGQNGYSGSSYETSLETWRTIKASDAQCGSGPCSFTVTNSNGTVFLYGATPDSQIYAYGRPDIRLWAVSSITDLNGNSIAFTYTSDPISSGGKGQYYITQIAYTANAAAGVTANRLVRFSYEQRPDVETHYQGGTPITTSYRLSHIETFAGTQIVRDYRIAYGISQASGRSEVLNVRACDSEAASASCVTQTGFQWQGSSNIQYTKTNLQANLQNNFSQLIPADFNGDGLGDLLAVSQTTGSSKPTAQVYLSTGTDFRRCSGVTALVSQGNVVAGDVNGDGRLDLIQLAMSGTQHVLMWYAGQSDGCTFTYQGTFATGLSAIGQNVWPMDFNGDGRTDIVETSQSGSTVTFTAFASTGNGFTRSSTRTISLGGSTATFQPMDVNGDGMTDIVQLWVNSSGSTYQFTSYLSSGTDFNTTVVTPIQPLAQASAFPVDVNGDGNADLVAITAQSGSSLLTTYLSNGIGGFILGTQLNTGKAASGTLAVWPMDTTGDGQTDLVQAWKDASSTLHLILYRNSGSGYGSGSDLGVQLSSANFDTTYPMDLSGDGRMSVLQGWPAGSNLYLTNYANTQLSLDRVSSIVNGLGDDIVISYLPMSDTRVYTRASTTATYPQTSIPGYNYRQSPAQYPFQPQGGGTLQLVWQYHDKSVSGAAYPFDYLYTLSYSSALMDFTGHGWLGFASVSRLNNQNGQLRVDNYNQQYPLTGTVAASQVFCVVAGVTSPDPLCPSSRPAMLSNGVSTWNQVKTASGASPPYPAIYLNEESAFRSDTYTYGTYNYSLGKAYTYDTYGQQILLNNLGYVSQAGADLSTDDNVSTCTQYSTWTGTPLLGFPTAIKVSSTPNCSDFTTYNNTTDFSLTHITYTPAMNIESQSDWDNSNSINLVTSFAYDAFGNFLTVSQPGNLITQYVYDSAYHTYPVTATSPPDVSGTSLIEQYAWDPRFGTQVGATDPNGFVSVQCIGTLAQRLATQQPVPNFVAVTPDPVCIGPFTSADNSIFTKALLVTTDTESYLSDSANTVYNRSDRLQDWSSGSTRSTNFKLTYFDGRGRNFQTVTQGLASIGNTAVCEQFNSTDQVTQESLPYYISGVKDSCTSTSSGSRFWITTAYDVYDRPTKSTTPAGADGSQSSVTTTSYPSSDTSVITLAAGDPYAIQKTLSYKYFNSERRLQSLIVGTAPGALTSFSYDRIGRLTSVVDPPTASNPNGVTNSIAYDSLNRRSTLNTPDQNTTGSGNAAVWAYSSSTGFLQSLTDARGQVSTYAYDQLGRVITQTLANGDTFQFTYDNPDPSARSLGQRSTAALYSASTTIPQYLYNYTYDTQDQPYITTLTLPSYPVYKTTTLYDPLLRLYQVQYPDGSVTQRTFQVGNSWQTTLDGNLYVTSSQYTPLGEAQNQVYGNGVAENATFAPTGEVSTFVALDAMKSPLLNQTVTWNHLYEVTNIADNLNGPTNYSQSFTHTLGRLTAATAPGLYGSESYSYDNSGNLIQHNDTSYTYSAHRILSGTLAGTPTLNTTYDANGNTQARTDASGNWAYSYDPLNRLTQASLNGQVVLSVPTVDQDGRRLLRMEPQAGATSIYATPDYLVTDYSNASSVATRYLMSPTGPLTAITTVLSGTPPSNPGGGYPTPGIVYFTSDYLGTTQLTTDENGLLLSRFSYTPFGAVIAQGTNGPNNVTEKFQAQDLDDSTKLYYFNARYYDPSIGRFTTPDSELGSDPLAIDTFNRFAFSLNDPVSQRDPSGHNIGDNIIGDIVGSAEIVAGIGLDFVSGGTLEPVGSMLINGGISGVMYSATDRNNFSWKQFGAQEGIGIAMGLLVPGFGSGELAGAETVEGASMLSRSLEEVSGSAALDTQRAAASVGAGALQFDEDASSFATEDLSQTVAGSNLEDTYEGEESDLDESCSVAGSFVSGTMVAAATGETRIDDVRPGDQIMGLDPVSRQPGFFTVVQTSHSKASTLLTIQVGNHVLQSTPYQRYWVVGAGWKPASSLAAGDLLRDEQGNDHPVISVSTVTGGFPVVAIEVAQAHSLFASQDGLLVHNSMCARLTALGATPGKWARSRPGRPRRLSRNGRMAWARAASRGHAAMDEDGNRWVYVQTTRQGNWQWKELDEQIHMGHIEDAVTWWNTEGFQHGVPNGRPSPQARRFMLSDNYEFEWGPLNSGNGPRLGERYRPPEGWTGDWPPNRNPGMGTRIRR